VVTTSLGKIRGYIKTSYDGRKFSAFEGVPFAKPPTGSRRFEVDISNNLEYTQIGCL
jgi:carboxylesterase type B